MNVTWTAEELAFVLDAVPSGVGVWDADLRCEFLNRAARISIGNTDDPYGRHLSELVPAAMYDAAVARVRRSAEGEAQQFVRVLADADGRQTYLDLAYLPLPACEGERRSIVAIGDDASADVAAEVLRRDMAPYLAAVQERERVADQLEHQLTTHLTALSLDLVELGLQDAALGEALQQAAQLTDAALHQLRSSIHDRGRTGAGAQLSDAVDQVLKDTTVALGFAPAFALRGPVETIGAPLGEEVLAVLREGLSNVARHAGATQVVAAVAVTRNDVTVTVVDDGRGIGDAPAGGGMTNLQARARRCGGTCTWGSPGTSGTMLEWRVPLPGGAREPVAPAPDTGSRDDLPVPVTSTSTAPVHISAERLLAVLDALPVIVGVWDADTRNVFANRACVEWFGRRDRDEVVGRSVTELASQEILVGGLPFVRAVLDGIPQHFERETADGTGAAKHIRAVFVPRVVDGRRDGFVAQIFDVTERVRKQRELRRSVEQMTVLEERRRIAEDLHDLVIQHLFAAGLRLDAARSAGVRSAVLDQAVARVDAAIARLRESIVGLRRPPTPS